MSDGDWRDWRVIKSSKIIELRSQSIFLDMVGICVCEGVLWLFLSSFSFFIMSGRYSRQGELPVMMSCLRFWWYLAFCFFLFPTASLRFPFSFSVLSLFLFLMRLNPASTNTSPSSSSIFSSKCVSSCLGSLWMEKNCWGFIFILLMLSNVTLLLISCWLFSHSHSPPNICFSMLVNSMLSCFRIDISMDFMGLLNSSTCSSMHSRSFSCRISVFSISIIVYDSAGPFLLPLDPELFFLLEELWSSSSEGSPASTYATFIRSNNASSHKPLNSLYENSFIFQLAHLDFSFVVSVSLAMDTWNWYRINLAERTKPTAKMGRTASWSMRITMRTEPMLRAPRLLTELQMLNIAQEMRIRITKTITEINPMNLQE